MPKTVQSYIRCSNEFRSREAASFFAQLEDQSQRLGEAMRDITQGELEWQPAPGTNTIGMLLAHLAIGEAIWTQVALLGMEELDVPDAIGVRIEDDGLPLGEHDGPPETLKGKDLRYYEDLLARTRVYFRNAAMQVTDSDMERMQTRRRADGSTREYNLRWGMYHIVEHFAQHFGQILALRHLYRAMAGSPSR